MRNDMKTVFSSHEAVSQVWALQTQSVGKTNAMFFQGSTIYSYGFHFPIARFTEAGPVLFTSQGYSSTTAKHKVAVRDVLKDAGKEYITVANVKAATPHDHQANANGIKQLIMEAYAKHNRAHKKQAAYATIIKNLVVDYNNYVDAFIPTEPHWDDATISQDILYTLIKGE